MSLDNLINKEKLKCPYCSRKVSYAKRFIRKDKGEYICENCNKVSNIKHNSNVWISLIFAAMFSLLILVFYLAAYKGVQGVYDEDGKLGVLVALFFGNAMIFKWILWEILPFAAFYFISPMFVEFYPQKRFMEQTQSKIDLSVPTHITKASKEKSSSNTRNIPKLQTNSFKGIYEDISSSSSSDIDKTRAFRVTSSDNLTDVNKERLSKSNSYSSDTPLVKMSREVSEYTEDDIKEYIPSKERIKTVTAVNKTQQKEKNNLNYSANRKF